MLLKYTEALRCGATLWNVDMFEYSSLFYLVQVVQLQFQHHQLPIQHLLDTLHLQQDDLNVFHNSPITQGKLFQVSVHYFERNWHWQCLSLNRIKAVCVEDIRTEVISYIILTFSVWCSDYQETNIPLACYQSSHCTVVRDMLVLCGLLNLNVKCHICNIK